MRVRIGLGVGHKAIRLVAVDGERVVKAEEATLSTDADLRAVVTDLLGRVRPPSWRRPTVCVALGPHASQVKVVPRLLGTSDPLTQAAIIRENPWAFFRRDWPQVVTTPVSPHGPDSVLVGSLDGTWIAILTSAIRHRGWSLQAVVPTAIVLPTALTDTEIRWIDDGIQLEVTSDGRRLETVRTRRSLDVPCASVDNSPVPGLAVLGEGHWRFADAYGAARLNRGEPLSVQFRSNRMVRSSSHSVPMSALILLCVAVLCLLLSPLGTLRSANRAEAWLATVRDTLQEPLAIERELTRMAEVISEVSRLSQSGPGTTSLLAGLAAELPEDAVVTALELEEQGVQMVILASDPPAAMVLLGALPGLEAPELVGSVQRVSVPAGDRYRLTMRFARLPALPAAQRSP